MILGCPVGPMNPGGAGLFVVVDFIFVVVVELILTGWLLVSSLTRAATPPVSVKFPISLKLLVQ